MTDNDIRVAIAEWGWPGMQRPPDQKVVYQRPDEAGVVFQLVDFPDGSRRPCYITGIPDYPNDLNAMHEAEEKLKLPNGCMPYKWYNVIQGCCQVSNSQDGPERATARQRCEALLRTIGKWKE